MVDAGENARNKEDCIALSNKSSEGHYPDDITRSFDDVKIARLFYVDKQGIWKGEDFKKGSRARLNGQRRWICSRWGVNTSDDTTRNFDGFGIEELCCVVKQVIWGGRLYVCLGCVNGNNAVDKPGRVSVGDQQVTVADGTLSKLKVRCKNLWILNGANGDPQCS